MRAPVVAITKILWLASTERFPAWLAARMRRDEEIIGRIPPAAAETCIGEVFGCDVLHRLAPRTTPPAATGFRCRDSGVLCGGGGAGPLADAVEVEDGEAAPARPDRGRSPYHVVANHALHGATGELVLDLLHQLWYPRRRIKISSLSFLLLGLRSRRRAAMPVTMARGVRIQVRYR